MLETKRRTDGFLHALRPSALLFVFLFLLAAVHFPGHPSGSALDASWKQALGHALLNHWQAGVDYVFTYGPLGYFAVGSFNRDLFWCSIAWEYGAKLIIAILFYVNLSKLGPAWPKWVFLVLFFLLPANDGDVCYSADLLYPLAIVLLYLTATGGRNSVRLSMLAAVLCAAISLTKLTFLILAVMAILALSANLLVERQGPRRWLAFLPISIFVVAFLGFWLGLNQDVANLPQFFAGSLQIVSGHGEAMHLEGNPAEVKLAGWVLAAFLGLAATNGVRKLPSFRHLTTAALLGLSLFLQWKQGFVRQDWLHIINFFAYTLCLAFLLPAAFPQCAWQSGIRIGLLSGAVLLSSLGVMKAASSMPLRGTDILPHALNHARRNLAIAAAPAAHRDQLQKLLNKRKQEWALPAIAAVVGKAPVDFISSEPIFLLLNNMNWRHRPVFQSYLAYTPYLLSLNKAWFQGPGAPPYLLVSLGPIDDRFPSLEDGPALLEILARYEPALREKHFLLLKRRQAVSPSLEWNVARQETVKFGEEFAVSSAPGMLQALTVKMRPSWWAQIAATLYKPPNVWLRVRTSTNQILRFRLIPAMAGSRFLLNPLVQNTKDFLSLFTDLPPETVGSLAIVTDGKAWFTPEVTVTVEECERPFLIKPSRSSIMTPGAGPANSRPANHHQRLTS
jgi:hypothetical protein